METSASDAILMIERLQWEKATAQMEAQQFKHYVKGHVERERGSRRSLHHFPTSPLSAFVTQLRTTGLPT
jgi:hypothetical protein